LFQILFRFRFRRHATTTELLQSVQGVHEGEAEECQEENDAIVEESAALSDEIEVWIHPPGLIGEEVKNEGAHPHPYRITGHEHESLYDFHSVDVESIVHCNLAEHEHYWEDVNRHVEADCHGSELDIFFKSLLLDCRIQDCPVDDDDNDVEDKATRIKELQEPQIPWRSLGGLSFEVARGELGDPVGVPSVQGKVDTEEEGADVGKKEEELSWSFVRSVAEAEAQSNHQIHGTKESENEEGEGREAP
jgi:hypothetical protein